MKKAIIIILTLVCSQGFAQVMGGLNYSTIDTKRKTSFHAGLFLEKDYKRITYRVEGYYSDQGDKLRRQRYMNFGLLPRYYFKDFFITAGPQLGILLSSKGESERVNQGSFGVLTGIGYRVDRFTLSARYTHGLSSNVQSPVSENRYPHRVGQLTLSYRWKK